MVCVEIVDIRNNRMDNIVIVRLNIPMCIHRKWQTYNDYTWVYHLHYTILFKVISDQ